MKKLIAWHDGLFHRNKIVILKNSLKALGLTLLAGLILLPPTKAQDTPTYTGLDVLFIVDQSGSMSGTGFEGQLASDPNGLRFEATQYALDTLAGYRQSIAQDL